MKRKPVWTDLHDQDFDGWLRHCSQLQGKMDRWIKKHQLKFDHALPEQRFMVAMYGELANLSAEAKTRLKKEGK